MAYTKKQKKLVRFVLTDLLSKVDGLIYNDPKLVGEKSAVLLDETIREEIISAYENPDISTFN